MAKTRTVKLGNRKRKWMNVVVPVEKPRTNPDGSLVVDAEGDPVVDVDERTYKVPLMGSLRSGELLLFHHEGEGEATNMEAVLAFHKLLSRYIPKAIVDELDMEDLDVFFDAWQDASAEADGTDLGE